MAEGAGEEKKKFSIWDLPDVPMGQLPPHLELQRSRVSCNKDAPIHIESIQYFGAYASMGIDNSSRLDRFSNNFRVEVVRLNEDDMEFDMIGSYMVNWSPKLQTAVSDLVYQEVHEKFRDAVIALIDKEREGEQIDRTLLKNVLGIFVEIGMGQMYRYEDDFEEAMLQDTLLPRFP
ncbi:hypothetical protein V6Z11_D02G186000 [Gossypium hirsutum]